MTLHELLAAPTFAAPERAAEAAASGAAQGVAVAWRGYVASTADDGAYAASTAAVIVAVVVRDKDTVVIVAAVVGESSSYWLLGAGGQILAEGWVDDVVLFIDAALWFWLLAACEKSDGG